MVRSGPTAFHTRNLEYLAKDMIDRCPTCQDEADPAGTFTVMFNDPHVTSPLHKAPQLLQLSRDMKGPWKVRFEGLVNGLYPAHLNVCSCHRLLTHMSKSRVEEELQLCTDMQVTVYECRCPGVTRQFGTDFKLAMVWQLPTNSRQYLKK